MRILALLMLVTGLALGGCAVKPPPQMSCTFTKHRLTVPGTEHAAGAGRSAASADSPYAAAIRQSLEAGAGRAVSDDPPALLSLSGGSLNGAYGAGYLDEWKRARGAAGLPRFVHVTGVSTGAILATFAFTGRTTDGVRGYQITQENQLLKPFVRMKNGDLSLSGYVKLFQRGSLGDLGPLRERLHQFYTDQMLQEVADGAADGRSLFVGVVDVDSGEAEALDLTDMAARWSRASDLGEKARLKACYVEAVVASSSAPMAAPPVFIDNRMYIDGGARFGMFAADFGAALQGYVPPPGGNRRKPFQYLIINGDQAIKPECGKADASLCEREPPTGGAEGAHKAWNLPKLALRSEKVLTNQVYRFSEAMVVNGGTAEVRSTLIKPEASGHRFTMDEPILGSGTKTCGEWHDLDRETMEPIQFFPRYMRCLIDYGRTRAREQNWAGGRS